MWFENCLLVFACFYPPTSARLPPLQAWAPDALLAVIDQAAERSGAAAALLLSDDDLLVKVI